ncbi:hypothetical protein ACIQ9Q_40725 [Streptomyces sp. NPDC094438]|uniref:hypothetical protein n=1 Tax=Streptomyces sp. NPDC094438 TaxID=3366061 RepID=UPI00382A0120
MTTPRGLTRTEWSAFHAAYLRGSTAACPECSASGQAVLRPLDRVVRFACGHELAVPDNTDPLPQPASRHR